MFNNNVEDEADFCEAYKSQILNDDSYEKGSSLSTVLKIVTILLLLSLIVGMSIYGYNYFMNNSSSKVSSPPVSIQSLEENELGDLKVELEPAKNETSISKKEEVKTEKIKEVKVVEKVRSNILDEVDINKIANDVKLAIAKNEQEELEAENTEKKSVKSESLKVPNEEVQSAYLEELAKLSKEIDKERE